MPKTNGYREIISTLEAAREAGISTVAVRQHCARYPNLVARRAGRLIFIDALEWREFRRSRRRPEPQLSGEGEVGHGVHD
jgi:hypothetical protein